jgi:eukaryotic-like serine/threonine-protein kinase
LFSAVLSPALVSQDDRPSGTVERTDVIARTRVLDGKYRLGRLIGEGGMGAVYEAEHEGLRARVAVKLLGEHGALDPKSVSRFRREARAMGAIRHENVVTVMDTGTDDEGSPYLVMELLEGESLAAVLRRERTLTPGLSCWIADQVLAGLEAAHERGVVHRDLKPGNIFLARRSDGSHRVKILDFGISKLGGDASTLNVTAEGAMIGTPHFMAPEQITGEAASDVRADLYAVGVLLYRMVTGRLPYVGSSSEELYQLVLLGQVTPPRSFNADVPAELESVILRAMAADRARRYQDATTFRAALRQVAALVPNDLPTATDGLPAPPGLPVHTPLTTSSATVPARPHVVSRRARGRGRTTALFALGGALVFALAAFGAVWLTRHRSAAAPSGPPLHYGIVQYSSADKVEAAHRPILDYLSRRLGRPVELVQAADEKELLDRFFGGGLELAALSPYAYVRAVRRGTPGLVLLAKPVTPDGPSYQGVILTRADSGIRSLADLAGKRFCYVNPGSTSGYLYPRALLRKAGLDPDRSFSSTSFGQEHLNTLRLLDRGACDAAAVFASVLHAGERAGMPAARFHQLVATDRIPYDAYAVPARTAPEDVKAIAGALLALAPGSDVARQVFAGSDGEIVGFTPADDSDYDSVRRIEEFMTGSDRPPP